MAIRKEDWRNAFECTVSYWADGGQRAVPRVVVQAIQSKYLPTQGMRKFNEIMEQLEWDHMNACYYFTDCGMYHGVEEQDGYIHT